MNKFYSEIKQLIEKASVQGFATILIDKEDRKYSNEGAVYMAQLDGNIVTIFNARQVTEDRTHVFGDLSVVGYAKIDNKLYYGNVDKNDLEGYQCYNHTDICKIIDTTTSKMIEEKLVSVIQSLVALHTDEEIKEHQEKLVNGLSDFKWLTNEYYLHTYFSYSEENKPTLDIRTLLRKRLNDKAYHHHGTFISGLRNNTNPLNVIDAFEIIEDEDYLNSIVLGLVDKYGNIDINVEDVKSNEKGVKNPFRDIVIEVAKIYYENLNYYAVKDAIAPYKDLDTILQKHISQGKEIYVHLMDDGKKRKRKLYEGYSSNRHSICVFQHFNMPHDLLIYTAHRNKALLRDVYKITCDKDILYSMVTE